MAAKNTSVVLGERYDKFIAELLHDGRYASASEVLREGLRLWRRAAPPVADTAAGRIADLTARNEGLRALCA